MTSPTPASEIGTYVLRGKKTVPRSSGGEVDMRVLPAQRRCLWLYQPHRGKIVPLEKQSPKLCIIAKALA